MKNRGCLIAFLTVVAIAGVFAYAMKLVLTPRDLSKEDPRQTFEWFVCSPLPPSVHDLKAKGIVAITGANVRIDFHFDPQDHDIILKGGKFQLADDKVAQWIKDFQPEGVTGSVTRYVRTNEGMTETAFFVADDRRKAWFREIRY
jgi:hypothetical protein